MAVGPEGPERLRRAQSPPGHCLGCSVYLFPGLGLRAVGLMLLGVAGGEGRVRAQQCFCRGLGWSVEGSDRKWGAGSPQAGWHLLLVPGSGGHSKGHLLRRVLSPR